MPLPATAAADHRPGCRSQILISASSLTEGRTELSAPNGGSGRGPAIEVQALCVTTGVAAAHGRQSPTALVSAEEYEVPGSVRPLTYAVG